MKFTKLVCALFMLCACGASVEDEQELGQTNEALTVAVSGGRSWGTDRNNFFRGCLLNGPSNQDCVWTDPYHYPPVGSISDPSKYQIYVNTTFVHQSGNLITQLNQVVSAFNGQMAGTATLEVTTHGSSGNMIDFESYTASPAPLAGDTLIRDYISYQPSGFGVVRSECVSPTTIPCTQQPNLPGTYRSAKSTIVGIDIDRLQANFPATQFAGNLKQVTAHVVLLALGAGEQAGTQPAYSNPQISTSVQSLSLSGAFMTSFEKTAAKKIAATNTSDTDTFVNFAQ